MKLTLISHTKDPLRAICTAIAVMKEAEPLKVSKKGHKEMEDMVKELMKTRLIGALEFATFEFLLEDVTRAFTHQLVRHRTFHFSQQSMRFFNASKSGFRYPTGPRVAISEKAIIKRHVEVTMDTYSVLVKSGCPIEDARSILPTNIHTKIMFGATFRGLLEMAEVRLCQQTQDEFREVMCEIKKAVTWVEPFLGSLLQPACLRSGKCEFKSIYDRPCPVETTLKGGK